MPKLTPPLPGVAVEVGLSWTKTCSDWSPTTTALRPARRWDGQRHGSRAEEELAHGAIVAAVPRRVNPAIPRLPAMGKLGGTATTEIDAPLEVVWAVVEDVLTSPEWQGGLLSMEPLETDAHGRATLVETVNDAKSATSGRRCASSTTAPRLSWRQEKGDIKSWRARGRSRTSAGERARPTSSRAIRGASSGCSCAARSSTRSATTWSTRAPTSCARGSRAPEIWVQRDIRLQPRPRGFHLVTDEVLAQVAELAEVRVGLLHLHSSTPRPR